MKKNKFIVIFLIILFLGLMLLESKSFAFSLPTTYINQNIPDEVIETVMASSYYKDGGFSGFFIFDYGKYRNCFRVLMFNEGMVIRFIPNRLIIISKYFELMDIDKNTLSISYEGYVKGYSDSLPLENYFFTGINCSLYSSYSEESLIIKTEEKLFYTFPSKEDITVDTFKFSQIMSKEYSSEFYNTYNAYVSFDGINWDIMSKEYSNADDSKFVFYHDVFENGTYQVRIFDESTGQYVYDDFVEVDNIPFEIYLEPSENTDKPIIAKSNIFGPDIRLQYSVYFSTDKKEWTKLNRTQVEPNEENPPDMRDTYFWTRIFKNGTYYFRFTYFEEEYEGDTLVSAIPIHFYVTKKIDNILVEDYMSDDYIFKPIISLDFNEERQSFIIRTQSILLDKALNLNCFYISYDKSEGFNPNDTSEEDNILGWNKMEIGFENNIYMNTSDGYFYFEIPAINATDTSYKIVFYNYISEKASEIVYYDFIYESAKDYVENDLKIHLGISVRLNDLLKSFESRFGILGFPMSVLRNFSNKILTLQLKEPVIYIPALYEPFYHNKIFNGTSFNFNSLLVSDSVIFVHEFYLTIVDMIFIYLFLKFCVKTLRDFIEKDK